MFQNNMAFHIPDSNITLYADDHQLFVTGKTYEEVESTLETQGQQALTCIGTILSWQIQISFSLLRLTQETQMQTRTGVFSPSPTTRS